MFKAVARNSVTLLSFDKVSGIVASSWIDGEYLIVADIHVWTEKLQKHMPGSDKPCLVNAGKEAGKVLVIELEITMFRKMEGEMLWMRHRDELENHPCQNVEHGPER